MESSIPPESVVRFSGMDENSTFNSKRAASKDIPDIHLLELGSFPVNLRLSLVATECNQNWLWPFLAFQLLLLVLLVLVLFLSTLYWVV